MLACQPIPPIGCAPSPAAGGLSFTATLLLANITCAAWLAVYHWLLEAPEERAAQLWRHDSADWGGAVAVAGGGSSGRAVEQQRRRQDSGSRVVAPQLPVLVEAAGADALGGPGSRSGLGGSEEQQRLLDGASGSASDGRQQQRQQEQQQEQQQLGAGDLAEGSEEWKPSKAGRMSWRERLQRTGAAQLWGGQPASSLSPSACPVWTAAPPSRSASLPATSLPAAALWPYMVPLLLVYFAEYAMQSGTWTAIGWRAPGLHGVYGTQLQLQCGRCCPACVPFASLAVLLPLPSLAPYTYSIMPSLASASPLND